MTMPELALRFILENPDKAGDEISIVPAIAGGRR